MGSVVAVAGEVLTDLVPAGADGLFRAAPGGSPANVAVGLARLGVEVRLLARLADDVLGRRLRAHLADNGVDLSRAVAAREPSSIAIVALAADGSADYDFRVDGTADWQWTDAELDGALDGVAALHVGSLALVLEPGGSALLRAATAARQLATVTFDPNVRPMLMGDRSAVLARVEEALSVSDVVKASEEDVAWLLPGEDVAAVAARWAARGPAFVVVTRGRHGALAVTCAGVEVRRPARPVVVADTVGAGDSFTGALLAGLLRRDLLGADRRDALREVDVDVLSAVVDEAVLVSSITCSRLGADPPSAAELTAYSGG